jgi:hypothetical protein
MPSSSRDDDGRTGTGDDVEETEEPRAEEEEDHFQPEPLDPESLEAERPAVGVDDVIEFFDREPPEHPTSESDVQPPFG